MNQTRNEGAELKLDWVEQNPLGRREDKEYVGLNWN